MISRNNNNNSIQKKNESTSLKTSTANTKAELALKTKVGGAENNLNIKKPPQQLKPITATAKYKKIKQTAMTKSYHFNINYALNYTCHRLNKNGKSIDFCGQCNSCQIINYLNNLKQWFDRASHITIKKFLTGLVMRISNLKIYKYLSDLLKPLTESKDFVYARNKFIPSCDQDHLKATNNRCLDDEYVNKQINDIWNWYSTSNNYIKLNFMLSLLNKCEQATVFIVILNIKSILDSNQLPDSLDSRLGHIEEDNRKNTKLFFDDSESEMVCDAFDAEEEDVRADDAEVQHILNSSPEAKYVDFIR